MPKAMASWEHLAAMLSRSSNPLPKISEARPKARKGPWVKAENKSLLEREKEKEVLQQNLWVASGSGRAPRVW